VLISGFERFYVRDKGERLGTNLVTGEDLMLTERRIVTFKRSTVVKRNLNGWEG
jgi:integration host factor subunit alpha